MRVTALLVVMAFVPGLASAPVYHLGRTVGVLVVGVTLDYLELRGLGG